MIEPDTFASACALCAAGYVPSFRPDTREWTHTVVRGTAVSHTLCGATKLRNENAR